jgi:molybdopterin-containing oxidoreductase family iron-sulfur binding subunit
MGASLALAALAGCDGPAEFGHPLYARPRSADAGAAGVVEPATYATVLDLDGLGRGVLVRTRAGHPIRIEGNPAHPASLGATDIFAESAVLSLHAPERSRRVLRQGRAVPAETLDAALAAARVELSGRAGAGLRILTGPVSSPTLTRLIASVLADFPAAQWHQHDPLAEDAALVGALRAHGQPLMAVPDLTRARCVLCLGADPLGAGPAQLRLARDWITARQAERQAGRQPALLVAEFSPSLTGARATRRLPLPPGEMAALARAVATALELPGLAATARHAEAPGIAAALVEAGPAGVVLAGRGAPAGMHALAHAINHRLGCVGTALHLLPHPLARPEPMAASIGALAAAMTAGAVTHLLILGANPAYDTATALGFVEALRRVPFTLHGGLLVDETAALSQWHVPLPHPLQAWGDSLAFEGTPAIRQPAARATAVAVRSEVELLGMLLGRTIDPREAVRETWREAWGEAGFEARWAQALEEGVAGPAAQPLTLALLPGWDRGDAPQDEGASGPVMQGPDLRLAGRMRPGAEAHGRARPGHDGEEVLGSERDPGGSAGTSRQPAEAAPAGSNGQSPPALTAVFVPDPGVRDGAWAHEAWLQEVPRPLTRLAWGNAALLEPATATRLGLAAGDEIALELAGQEITAPAWPVPGHAPDCVTLPLGGGRRAGGPVGEGRGFDAYALRPADGAWLASGLTVRATGRRAPPVTTEGHYRLEGSDPARAVAPGASLPDPPRDTSLHPDWPYPGHAWGMVIDLDACIGCNACAVACQAENNVPVVGPAAVARGRAMHWLRIDHHRRGPADNPDTVFQPVPCMHCEQAPCEPVCPVNATLHDHEGLNLMVHARCIGTRTCANNCPYKVRRFNWADHRRALDRPARNPEVPLRPRGVMEKCTYCQHRIVAARTAASVEDRALRDGEIETACQRACPTRAITFGDLNDPASAVARARADGRHYALLGELGTRPRTTYLARVEPDAKERPA